MTEKIEQIAVVPAVELAKEDLDEISGGPSSADCPPCGLDTTPLKSKSDETSASPYFSRDSV